MSRRDPGLGLDSLEHEVGRVDLAVGMRVRYSDDFTLVLEDQNMIDLCAAAKFDVLLAPDAQQVGNLADLKLGQRKAVIWAVADDAGDARRGAHSVNAIEEAAVSAAHREPTHG